MFFKGYHKVEIKRLQYMKNTEVNLLFKIYSTNTSVPITCHARLWILGWQTTNLVKG